MIKIYCMANNPPSQSSAGRSVWALEEVGVDYEMIRVDFSTKEHKAEAYLNINPNGAVPCLKDNELIVWESMAINFYLGQKYKPELSGNTPEETALINQWSYWSITTMQTPLLDLMHQNFAPEEKKNHESIEKCTKAANHLFSILDKSLDGKDYLVAGKFTLADLNAYDVASISQYMNFDISNFPNLKKWFENISSRPALKKAMGIK